MNLPKEDPARVLTVILYGILSLGAVYIFFRYLFFIILPFALGFFLALFLRPGQRLICKRTKIPCKIVSVILVSVCGAFVFFLLYMLFSRFYKEGRELASKLSFEMFNTDILDTFRGIPVISAVISAAEGAGVDLIKSFGGFFEEKMPKIISGFAEFLPSAIFFFAAFIFSAVYFLSDYEKIRDLCRKKLSGTAFSKLGLVKRKTVESLCGFLKGYFIIMLITFAELFLGFIILGINYAFLLASVTAVIDILPILGVGIVLLPWAIYEFSVGNAVRAVGLCVLFVVISGVRQFSEPAILGKKVGLHPLFSMFSMYLGYKLFGFIGMLFFPFLSSLVKEITTDGEKEQ